MKILFINPPRFHELIGKNPAIVEKHRGFNPPLGILSLAGYLERHTDHEIHVIDAQPLGWSYGELKEEIARVSFDVCGITAMTFTLIDVLQTCRVVREVNPDCKIVLGGPHVHLFPDQTIRQAEVDFLIQGEGEIAFADFLDKVDCPALWPSVPGLVYVDAAGGVKNNGIAPSTKDLDTLGFPARHRLDVKMYTSLLGRNNVITTMFTSRGCPFRCTFCDRPFSPVLSGFRWRSAKHVVEEIEECLRLGVSEAFIYDDTFTVRKDRVHELCDEIIKRKLKFCWDVRAHVNTVDKDLLKHMAEAGCDRIHYGVECGNDRMMRVIRKNTTVEKVKNAVKLTKEANMEVLTYFIIGQQTETLSDIQDTMDLARVLSPNYAHFTVFCPYPGTEIYMKGLESGVISKDVWREFAESPASETDFQLPVWEEIFTRQELREMLVKCYKSFYLRPTYVLRNLARVRSAGELKRKVRAGLSVLTMTPNQKVYDSDVMAVKARQAVPHAPIELHS
jgi:radical SAM superfamily enzyme YgiQ (UPF0313 family)